MSDQDPEMPLRWAKQLSPALLRLPVLRGKRASLQRNFR